MARLSIGEFAQACGLTPKALRLYDELGLLPPAHVDPRSGYRSYEHRQLERARLVAWLRGLGMPLTRIRTVCDLPPAAAASEVASYWRQVEADTAARKELATFLIDQLSRKDTDMTERTQDVRLRAAARLECGPVRSANQDAAYAGTHLFAVADGFGAGSGDGSAGATVMRALEPLDAPVPAGRLPQAVGAITSNARRAVEEFIAAEPAHSDTGTTLTALLWSSTQVAIVHIGDSRAYLLRSGELTRITHDHTLVQSLVDEGRLTPEEAATHPRRATLIRALHHEHAEPDLQIRQAQAGDRYLLCSDGVHAVLPEATLTATLAEGGSAEQVADTLLARVADSGAPDNAACVVVDVLPA